MRKIKEEMTRPKGTMDRCEHCTYPVFDEYKYCPMCGCEFL